MHFLFCVAVAPSVPLDLERVGIKTAPAYPCDAVEHFEKERVSAFFYKYDYEISEVGGSPVVHLGHTTRFSFGLTYEAKDPLFASEVFGDYLKLEVDCKTLTGYAVRPRMSFIPLFMYEDNGWLFLSSEIGLITQVAPSLRGRALKSLFDQDFINDSIFNEWGDRQFPYSTAVRGITRLLPHDRLTLEAGRIRLEKGSPFAAKPEQYALYERNRPEFYARIIEEIVSFGAEMFSKMQRQDVTLDLSGGLDSRCTLVLLREISRRTGIVVKTRTYGPEDHPDVVVANQIAAVLALDHQYVKPAPTKPGTSSFLPRSSSDYWNCFILSQGDWNSNNYRTSRASVRTAQFTGQDNYKRMTVKQAIGLNRWYSRRMTYTQILPILANDGANLCAAMYHRSGNPNSIYEFVYQCLLLLEPKLLDVPFAGIELPMHPVKPFKTIRETKVMPHMLEPAFYDEKLVASIGLNISKIDDERKRRIAMDFACAGEHIFGEWE